MNNLYTYIVRFDTGLAPNPFWGWCTLAVCTPNHQGSRVETGDWIAGFFDKGHGHKFLYAMEVCERIHMADYFEDERFQQKKPRADGSWMEQCGDNFYSQDELGDWQQHWQPLHAGCVQKEKDTKNPWVFVAKRFWYLGREAQALPDYLKPLAGGRGARVKHPAGLVDQFKIWVQQNFAEGVTALPRDLERFSRQSNSELQLSAISGAIGIR